MQFPLLARPSVRPVSILSHLISPFPLSKGSAQGGNVISKDSKYNKDRGNMKPALLLLFVYFGLFRICFGGKCYYPNGEISLDVPCDPDAEYTACCARGGLSCLANRLCLMPSGEFGRGSCTDPTWQSPECPKFCTRESLSHTLPRDKQVN